MRPRLRREGWLVGSGAPGKRPGPEPREPAFVETESEADGWAAPQAAEQRRSGDPAGLPRSPCLSSTHIFWGEERGCSAQRWIRGESPGAGQGVSLSSRCPPDVRQPAIPRSHGPRPQTPRHATPQARKAGRRLSPSTYLTGLASPGTKVSWDHSRALTSMPPSRAEVATRPPGNSLKAPRGRFHLNLR